MPMGGVMTARPTPARSVGVVTAVPSGRAAPLPPKPSHPRDRRGDAVAASWLLLDRHLAERDERPRLAVDVEPADLAGRRPDEGVRLDPGGELELGQLDVDAASLERLLADLGDLDGLREVLDLPLELEALRESRL